MPTAELNFKSTNQTWTLKAEDAGYTGYPNSGQLSFYNGATKLWGLNESGWVQNSSKPAFYVRQTATNTAFAANSVMTWNDIHFNNGNHFSNGSTFTAPIDGLYFFSCMVMSITSQQVFHSLRKNNTIISGTSTQTYMGGGNNQTVTISTVYQLNVGDYVDAYCGTYTGWGGTFANFNGCLL